MKKNELSLKVIIPFVASMILIILIALTSIYTLETDNINELSLEEFEDVSKTFTQTINRNVNLLQGFNKLIQKDENLINLYKEKDRDKLFLYLYQTYLDFNYNYNVTHFYIHNLDKTNFVRIHNRDLHSDNIHRYTLNKAIEKSTAVSGIEFSLNHNYTLRVVLPWLNEGELIGYIELGEEIDKIINELSNTLNNNIILTINKNLMDTRSYEKWKKENSNSKKYIELDNYYIPNSIMSKIVAKKELLDILNSDKNIKNIRVDNNELIYDINSEPFYDVTGKEVGKIYVLVDVTNEVKDLDSIIIEILTILVIFIILIIYFYYKYINKIDTKINNYVDKIEFNYEFEQYINNISKHLIHSNSIDTCINNTIKELGTILNAHRAYLFLFRENYSIFDNTHEWCSVGTKSEKDDLQNVPTEDSSWFIKQCKELKPIVVEDVNTLPIEAAYEKEVFTQQGIKSLLIYPVSSTEGVLGFVGIDMVHNYQKWTETHHSFVRITAESIANTFDKMKYEEDLFESRNKMSLTLNTASNGILAVDANNFISFYNKKLLQIWELNSIDDEIDTLEKLFELVSSQYSDYDTCLSHLHHFNENREKEQIYIFYLKNTKVIEIISAPSFDNGEFKGNSMSFRDITKKVSFEKELQLSAKVFENSLEGIVITDADTNIIKVNDSFSRITGYSRDELIGNKPTVLQSNWHDKEFYINMWKCLKRDSIWEGEVKDRRKNGELYVNLSTLIMIKDSEGKVANYIGINRDVTDLKKAEDHIKSLAYYDSLTNLPNRTLFYDRLEQGIKYAKTNKEKIALLFIDLDNFKPVNDTHGHHVGDLLLQKVAQILVGSVRSSDTVSRLGGDEFTIILKKVNGREDVVLVANKIIAELLEPVIVNSIHLDIGSSIGAAIFPDDTQDEDILLKMADSAMYNAKNSGKNCLKFVE